ncbi:MAG: AI-2E family transporter [Candidatus Gracilibacteria bacterium]|nr:AI-2E family transporter [Candidatus Peregrinibacteria bacterium]
MARKKKSKVGMWWEDVQKRMKKLNKKKAISFLKAEVPHLHHQEKKQTIEVEFNHSSVAKATAIAALTILFFVFLYYIGGILLLFFIAFLFAAALDPLVDFLEAHKIPRFLGMLLVYLVLFFFVGLFVSKVAGLVADQVVAIAQNINGAVINDNVNLEGIPFGKQLEPYMREFVDAVDIQSAAVQVQNVFSFLSDQVVSISIGLFNTLIVLILAFFMVVEERFIDDFFLTIFPSRYGSYVSTRMAAVKDNVGLWLRGQFLVSVIATILSYIGLALMGVNYALTLALISGVGMTIPVVGRFFAWVPTVLIVASQSPELAFWMSIYYLIIQQFENNLIVPYVMNRAVGLNPIVIIFALMVGGQFLPVLGWVLAIPVATTIAIFVKDFTRKGKEV